MRRTAKMLAVAAAVAGQGGGPPADAGRRSPAVIGGEVERFTAAPGLGNPELAVAGDDGTDYTFTLGPYFWLDAQGFVASPSDRVEVTVIACPGEPGGLAVVQVVNVTKDLRLVLRDATTGRPLWKQNASARAVRARVRPAGARSFALLREIVDEGRHIDLAGLTWSRGTYEGLTGAHTLGVPTLLLRVGDGVVAFLVSPYWVLLEENRDIEEVFLASPALEVYAAPAVVDGETLWVAFTIRLDSGLELVLREPETGKPVTHR